MRFRGQRQGRNIEDRRGCSGRAAEVPGTTETVRAERFEAELGEVCRPPVLVLFSGITQSPCGGASGATGPFCCPADRKAGRDTAFFATLARDLGAPGELAAACVIAHELGHHVQNAPGIPGKANEVRSRLPQAQANEVLVWIELQADCLAGASAGAVKSLLHPGDIEQALNAARRIGDDALQRRAGRVPQPHTFSHGTSAQRARWFAKGYEAGATAACDTFAARTL